MSTRDFNLIVGPETSTLPTATTPTVAADTVTKGWVEEYGFNTSAIHAPVSNITALSAITAAIRQDKQLCLVEDAETLFRFDAESTTTADGVNVIAPDAGSGRWHSISGASVGGGKSQITKAIFGESVYTTTNSKTMALSQKNCLYIQASKSWLDITEVVVEYPTQILSTDAYFLIHDLGATLLIDSESAYDACDVIKTALNANGDLGLTYDCTYSSTTRKITYSAGSNFSINYNTGVHAGNMLNLGADETSDKTGASSYLLDNPIEDATEYTQRAYLYQTDANYLVKSSNYRGLRTSAATKGQTGAVVFGEQTGFTLTAGESYYTKRAVITITAGTNDALDWKEGAGAEINSTITAGTYARGVDSDPLGFRTLCLDIKTQMEADNGTAETYTVTYDKNLEVFKVVNDGSNSFTFLFLTGTNNATSIDTKIGFAHTDTSSAPSQTSANRVEVAGQVALVTDDDVTVNSVYAGVSADTVTLLAEKEPSISKYSPIYSVPHDFLTTPLEYDKSAEIVLLDMDFNSQGVGLRIFSSPVTGGGTLYIQRSTTGGLPWTNASTSLAMSTGSVSIGEDYINGTVAYLAARCKVDENGYGVIAYPYYNGANWDTKQANSTDLDTWASGNLQAGGTGEHIMGLAIRENKAVIWSSAAGVSYIRESDNVGSGYTTWTTNDTVITTAVPNYTSECFIQYFPEQVGAAKYRIVAIGFDTANTDIRAVYWSGGLAGKTIIDVWSALTNIVCRDVGISLSDDGNRIVVTRGNNTATTYNCAYSNIDYNGGVLTFNTMSTIDINSGGSALSEYNGFTAESGARYVFNCSDRTIILGNKVYIFSETDSNGALRGIEMFYSTDITTGIFGSKVYVSNSGVGVECVQPSACYIASSHSILLVWKQDSAVANALVEGQIFARIGSIQGDGTVVWGDITQIDGGQATANFQGLVKCASHADGAFITWEHYDGSTRDVLWSNVLA